MVLSVNLKCLCVSQWKSFALIRLTQQTDEVPLYCINSYEMSLIHNSSKLSNSFRNRSQKCKKSSWIATKNTSYMSVNIHNLVIKANVSSKYNVYKKKKQQSPPCHANRSYLSRRSIEMEKYRSVEVRKGNFLCSVRVVSF